MPALASSPGAPATHRYHPNLPALQERAVGYSQTKECVMRDRRHNDGIRKVCKGCSPRAWAKCEHSWYFNYKEHRFSVDMEMGTHIASKTEVEALAVEWRKQIDAGTFVRSKHRSAPPPELSVPVPTPPLELPTPVVEVPPVTAMTFDQFRKLYGEIGRTKNNDPISANDRSCLGGFSRFVNSGETIGSMPITRITDDVIDLFFGHLDDAGGRDGGATGSTYNKYVQAVTAAFRWAAHSKRGYLIDNPTLECEALVRRDNAKRDRRVLPDEEERLLEVAKATGNVHLARLIVGAVESLCRRGELIKLRWRDVNLKMLPYTITIHDENTKTATSRVIPISKRLLAWLDTMRKDPTGRDHLPTAYVFGDEVGRPLGDVKTAWSVCVLKAHGYTPTYAPAKLNPDGSKKSNNGLSEASREALRTIDLHFHDLRHEGGLRLLGRGVKLTAIQKMYGHATLYQTSTYLHADQTEMIDEMERHDTGTFAPPIEREVSRLAKNLQKRGRRASANFATDTMKLAVSH